jgi:hypothetical protein
MTTPTFASLPALSTLYGNSPFVKEISTQLDLLCKKFPKELSPDGEGHNIAVVVYKNKARIDKAPVARAGNNRLSIYFLKDSPLQTVGVDIQQVYLRHDLPLALLSKPVEKFTLYHIRFFVPESETRFDDTTVAPLFKGYFGVTKRNFMQRFGEHLTKAKANTGSLLHSVWHSLMVNDIKHYPVVQLTGSSSTLKGVYKLEEMVVAEHTLTPMGLNAIPGGEAGIKMLHQLALLKGRKVGIDERDAAVDALQQQSHDRASPCAHYRKGHARKLSSDKLTFVKPCWVKLKEVL